MITHLKGTLEKLADSTVQAPSIIIDVGGVGYSVICSSRMINSIRDRIGMMIHVHTILNVREDSWTLFGFMSEREKFWFNMLVSVQGVGGKVAIAILSALSDDDLYGAFLAGDKNMLTRADGVGLKLATRIISELKDKILGKADLSISAMTTIPESGVINDVTSALMNLGYQKIDIITAVASMHLDQEMKFDQLFRKILSKLSSGA